MGWSETSAPVLRVSNLTILVNDTSFLRNINFAIQSGEIIAMVGRNGVGKSTLLKTIAGEHQDFEGTIELGGKSLQSMSLMERAKHIAVLPQQSQLAFPYRVYDVVSLGRTPHASGTQIDREVTMAALAQFDAGHLVNRLYTQLSGGEKQRVQIARVLCQIWRHEDAQPRLLLLDEPLNSLDLSHQALLMSAIKSHAATGMSILMVMHDINVAAQHATKLLALNNSRVSHFDTCDAVLTSENIKQIFSVDAEILTDATSGKTWVSSL